MEYWSRTDVLDSLIKQGIITLDRGRVISSIDLMKYPGDYPVYSSSAQKNGYFGSFDLFDFNEELITWSVDGGGYFFYRPKHKFSVTNVSGILRIAKSDKIDYKFLYYLLVYQHKNQIFDYVDKAHPSVIKKRYFIPEIEFKEQTQIATILSKVDEAITKTEQLIAKYTRIKTGLMQDLLTKGIDENGNIRSEETHEFKDSPLGRIPKVWECDKLGNIGKVSRGKFTPRPRNNPIYYGGKYPFIQTGDISNCKTLYLDNYSQTLNEKGVAVSKRFSKGTIVMTIAANIGDTAILKQDMYLTDSVVGIKSKLNEIYLELFFKSIKTLLENTATQSAQKNINIEKLNQILIKFPTSSIEQEVIVNKYTKIGNLIYNFETQLSKLQSLKTGLMQDLLSGKVRVNHLIKETASV